MSGIQFLRRDIAKTRFITTNGTSLETNGWGGVVLRFCTVNMSNTGQKAEKY
jgi:hypothetical protein